MRIKFFIILVPLLLLSLTPAITAENDKENAISAPDAFQKIAFASKRDGNYEIYIINEDGTGLTRLTNSKFDDLLPRWSPDGSKLLYLSKKGSKHEIWIMHSDGGGQTKLANDCTADYPPLWSPDGSKILFTAKYKSKIAVFAVGIDGSNLIRLTENGFDASMPSWSPDGTKILYLQRSKDDVNIYLINPDGTGRQNLSRDTGVCKAAAWSPDGRRIAYIGEGRSFLGSPFTKFYVMNADGVNGIAIANASKNVVDTEFQDDFCWSPDGAYIAFTKLAMAEEKFVSKEGSVTFRFIYGTYMVNADGNSNDIQLGTTGEQRAYPCWAPDSSQVAYLSESKLTIHAIKSNIDNQLKVNVSIPLSDLQWSPDGKKILFAGKNSSFQKSALYLVTLADGNVIKLSEANDIDPVWAPVVNK